MNTSKILITSTLISFAFTPFMMADLEKYIEKDKALLTAYISNVEKTKDKLDKSILSKHFKKGFEDFFKKEMEKKNKKEDIQYFSEIEDFLKSLFKDELLVSIIRTKEEINLEKVNLAAGGVLLSKVTIKDKELVEKIREFGKGEKRPILEDVFQNHPVYNFCIEPEDNTNCYFTIVEGVLVVSFNKSVFNDVIESILSGKAKNSLVDDKEFLSTTDKMGKNQGWVYSDSSILDGWILDILKAKEAGMSEEEKALINPTAVYKTFAIDSFDNWWMAFDCENENIVVTSGTSLKDERGLAGLLNSSNRIASDDMKDFPENSQMYAYNTSQFTLESIVGLVDLLKKALPNQAPMLDMGILELKKEIGVDVISVLKNFDYGVRIVNYFDKDEYKKSLEAKKKENKEEIVISLGNELVGSSNIYAFGIKNKDIIVKLLEKLASDEKTKALGIALKTFGDKTYYTMEPVPGEKASAIYLTDKYVYFSDDEVLVKKLIEHQNNPKKTLADQEIVKKAYSMLPSENENSFAFSNIGVSAFPVVSMINQAMMVGNFSMELDVLDFEFWNKPIYMTTKGYRIENNYYSKTIIFETTDSSKK